MVAHDTSYVDDVAQPVLAPANAIAHKVANTVTKVYEVFAAFALEVNFNPGKTECIISFVGVGSKAASVELSKNGSRIFLPDVGPDVFINVVDAYKHVGTQCSVSASIRHEITNRVAIMSSESRALRKILRKAALPLNRKINTMQGYIFSKGLFQAGTWPALPPVQYKRIHSCILRLYRDVTRQYWSNTFDVSSMFSDNDVI